MVLAKDIGGGNSIKLTVLYYIAKVYFAENYVHDIRLSAPGDGYGYVFVKGLLTKWEKK